MSKDKLFGVLTPPFKYDYEGQLILDSKNIICLDVRGWGSFDKLPHGDKLQDQFGEFVVKTINDALKESGGV